MIAIAATKPRIGKAAVPPAAGCGVVRTPARGRTLRQADIPITNQRILLLCFKNHVAIFSELR